MPSKKKKYNARFPPARIKKIMQTDDEIGKVAAAVPVLISKSLEMFLTSILLHTGEVTKAKQAKTMSTSHLKECIINVSMFDFLKEVVADVPDMQHEDEPTTSGSALGSSEEVKKLIRKRSAHAHAHPKPPKKSAKMTKPQHSTSEDNESTEFCCDASDEEDNVRNTGSSHTQSSSDLSHPNTKRLESSGLKAPSHTAVEKFTPVGSELPLSTDPLLRIVTPEEKGKTQVPKPGSIDINLNISNGLSPQKPMDLSINARKTHTYVSKTTRAIRTELSQREPPLKQQDAFKLKNVENNLRSSVSNAYREITTSVTMPHVYNPQSILFPSVSDASEKDVKTKIPSGGMLSFLYSSYPADSSLSANASSIANLSHLQPVSHINRTYSDKSRVREPGLVYPYNPVAEHHKKLNYLTPHPDLPTGAYQTQTSAPSTKPNTLYHNTEDDDYDA